MSCLLCGGATHLVMDLGPTPLANELPDKPGPVDTFPLELVQCGSCKHLQLSAASLVPRERLYRDYVYLSNSGPGAGERFRKYATELTDRFSPQHVVDIGSNDGLFLKKFACATQGVEPDERLAAEATKQGISTYHGFFDEETGKKLRERVPQGADLITANNVFAHNADLFPMLRGVRALLSPKGTFVGEVSYAAPVMRSGLFDLVYHEHIHHWHLGALSRFLFENGLRLFDAEALLMHGGSLRFYARHLSGHTRKPTSRLETLLRVEETSFAGYVDGFAAKVLEGKKLARAVIDKALSNMGGLVVLGWPAKACTLVSHYGLGGEIRRVFDDNPAKIGRATQFGQTIESSEAMVGPMNKILIGSWNYADAIMAKHHAYAGKFLIPLPTLREQ